MRVVTYEVEEFDGNDEFFRVVVEREGLDFGVEPFPLYHDPE